MFSLFLLFIKLIKDLIKYLKTQVKKKQYYNNKDKNNNNKLIRTFEAVAVGILPGMIFHFGQKLT